MALFAKMCKQCKVFDGDEPDFCGLPPNFLVSTEYNKDIGIPCLGV